MDPRYIRVIALLLLLLFAAAGVHALVPHSHDTAHGAHSCALCVLFWSLVVVVAAVVGLAYDRRTRALPSRPADIPAFFAPLPLTTRAPPAL
jgi:hypothetical protein